MQRLEKAAVNMVNDFKVFITGYTEETIDGKKVTLYIVECSLNNGQKKWTVKRRFSEFEKLHDEFKKTHRTLPPMPGKTLFSLTNKDDLERRRRQLEEFLQSLASREDVYCKKEFSDFLDLEAQQPTLSVNQLQALAELNHKSMGFRDAALNLEEGYGVAALHHIKVTSRIDSYFKGMFQKKKTTETEEIEDKVTVGVLQFLARPKDSKEITDLAMVWQKKYTSQAICVALSHKLAKVAVGLDNGDIYVYGFDPANPLSKDNIEETHHAKAHSSRVMRVIFDEKNDRIFSVSDDKKLRVAGTKSKEETSLKGFESGCTDMAFNPETKVAIVTDSGNHFYVIDMGHTVPAMNVRIKVEVAGPLRGLDVDWKSNLIFLCSYNDGVISIYRSTDLADTNLKPEPHALIKCFTKCRCLKYWKERNEIYVGYSNGYMTVFKLDIENIKGKLIAMPTCNLPLIVRLQQ